MKRFGWFLGMCCGVLLCATTANAQDFKPFTKVKDVCPACPKKASDKITLNNNLTITAKIVAENNVFYVLSLYGEIRTVPKARIMSVEWANGNKPSGLVSQDQIVLKNGVVLNGSIAEEKNKPGFFRMQSSLNNQTFIVFKDQIRVVYKAGTEYTFKR